MGRQMRMSAVVSLCLAVMAAVGGAAAADLGGGEATAVDAKPSVDLGSDDVVAAAPQPGMLAKDRAASMVTLDPEDAGAGADLGEALQGLAGVHVESLGGLGKLATMSIRGSSGNQVAVFMDGIRLSGGTGSVDLSNYPLRHFSRVEVVRGSAGAQYGDAAVGGVVNLVTPRAKPGAWGSLTTRGGLFTGRERGGALDVLELSTVFGQGAESWQGVGSVQGLWSNGKFLFEPDADLGLSGRDQVRRNNGVASLGALLKGSWFPSDTWELYGLADLYAADKEIPGLVSFPTPRASQHDRRFMAAAGVRAALPFGPDAQVDGRVSFLARETDFRDPGGGTTGFPLDIQNDDRTFAQEFSVRVPLGAVHDLRASQQIRREVFSGTAGDRGDRARTLLFLSASDTLTLASGAVALSPRAGVELASPGDTLYALGLGAAWDVTPSLTLRANGGNGFRRPTFMELYYDQGFYAGNPDLDPERSIGFDVGPQVRLGPVEAEANYFYTAYDDLIVYLLQSGFRFRPYNVGRATAQGVEVSGSVRVGTVARLHANWTYADVVDRGRDASWRGRQVPGKPRNQVFFRTEFTLDPVIPYAEYHFVGKNPVTRANTKLLDARHLVHAGVRWKATPASWPWPMRASALSSWPALRA